MIIHRLCQLGIVLAGVVIVMWTVYTLVYLSDLPRLIASFVACLFALAEIVAVWLILADVRGRTYER
jgi:hypothetical protein